MSRCRPYSPIVFVVSFLPIAVLAVGLSGCNKTPTAPVAASPGSSTGPATKSVGKPVTDEESLALAEEIDKAVSSGDPAALDRLIDWDSLNQRSTAGIDAPENFRSGFIKGLNNARTNGKGLANSIVDVVKKGGSYTLIHSHTRENRPWLLFRLLVPESGVNYYDLLLARRPDGKVKVVDIHVFLNGELISQTFRRGYVQLAAQSNAGLLARLTGADQKMLNCYTKLAEMTEATRNGQFRAALDIYKAFPADIQKEKSVLMARLQAAQNVGDEGEYTQSIEDFRKAHPDDPCIDILSIDYYTMKKQYPEALGCIDRLDRAVEGDPYLGNLRAGVHMEQNDLAAARADLKKAMDADPGLIDFYWSLVTVSLKDKNYDETLKTLRLIREKFHLEMADLKSVPLYKEFTESPQYQEWLKVTKGAAGNEAAEKPKE
jgi:tetratricopeptide (TPR) repeat protein